MHALWNVSHVAYYSTSLIMEGVFKFQDPSVDF
jgi:hypothetical protein